MKRTRTMAYTHAEFKRLLQHALDGHEYAVNSDVVESRSGEQVIRIRLGPEYERRIASLSMPVCDVTIELEGFSETQAKEFLERFDRTYRRGGG